MSLASDRMHGQEIDDPYRWLEDASSAQTREWIAQQQLYTQSYMQGLPHRAQIGARVEELLARETRDTPCQCGEKVVFLRRRPMDQQACICLSDAGKEEPICLVNPADEDPTGLTSVHIVSVSHTGRYLAYGVKRGGEDSQVVQILDIHSMRTLPERLPRGSWCYIEWSDREDGFYYVQLTPNSPRSVYYHHLYTNSADDLEIFTGGTGDGASVGFTLLETGKLLCIARSDSSCFEHRLSIVDPATRERATILTVDSPRFIPLVDGTQVFAFTDLGSPNRRVVRFPLDNAGPENWVEVVPESDRLIKRATLAGGQLFVSYANLSESVIRRFTRSGMELTPAVSSFAGTIELFRGKPRDQFIFYQTECFFHSPAIFKFDTVTSSNEPWHSPAHELPSQAYTTERLITRSNDGTSVPYCVLSARDHKRSSAERPTIMTSYAGFASATTPRFSCLVTVLLERGYRFVLVNARGGGELGEAWHKAGARQNRQKSFEDVIAVAEALIAGHYTAAEHLAIVGGSNGGLVAAAVVTQRPELFRAALCVSPLLDMLRYHLFDFAKHWAEEYGVADDPNDFRSLLGYSPYHGVRMGTPYPAILFVTGDLDTRCNPLHVRKMVARLQTATTSNLPVLVDYSPVRGHSPALPLAVRIGALTDRICFLIHQIDGEGANP